MSGFTSFVRRLQSQPGVQLNPILQAVKAAFGGDADQVVALAARLTRGRIDRAFLVNAANLERMTGIAESMRVNVLNEARLQMSEALKNGAASVLVSRIVPAAAEKRYAGVKLTKPPVFMLVSNLYPLSMGVEALDVGAAVVGMNLREPWHIEQQGDAQYPAEAVGVECAISGMVLRDANVVYTTAPEALSVSGAPTAMTLDEVLIQYDEYAPELLNVTATVTGMGIRDLLITNTVPAEHLDVTATVGAMDLYIPLKLVDAPTESLSVSATVTGFALLNAGVAGDGANIIFNTPAGGTDIVFDNPLVNL